MTLNKIALLIFIIATPLGAMDRNAGIMDAVQRADAINRACEAEGHTVRYCEWRYNFDHWPWYPMYENFEEHMSWLRLPKHIIKEELEKNGVPAR